MVRGRRIYAYAPVSGTPFSVGIMFPEEALSAPSQPAPLRILDARALALKYVMCDIRVVANTILPILIIAFLKVKC